MDKKKVLVGLSGGVDSSVAAYLLMQQGYEVTGVTMRTWCEDGDDHVEKSIADAAMVAKHLGIPHVVVDFREAFHRCIIEDFIEEYKACRTPNPCIRCNRYIKWEALLSKAKEMGFDYIATGHYARIIKTSEGRLAVADAVTPVKDQTYALYLLTQQQLAQTLMPVGEYQKEEIRRIAAEAKIPVADKADSQDICFIPDGDYAAFIKRNVSQPLPGEGNFVDREGNVLGRHKGLIHYTIGQRKGLNLAMGEPVFVTGLLPDTGEVVIGKNEDVFSGTLRAGQVNAMGIGDFKQPVKCRAKIRYAHKGADCVVREIAPGEVFVEFDEPQRAITPGQSVVFYGEQDGVRYVLGGGVISGGGER